MWYVRGLVCAFAVMLATVSFAEGEEGAVDETPNKVEELLNSKLAERIKVYLIQGLLESEQLSQYVDREYWNSIKDDFGVRVSTVITEDKFIQAALPILESVRVELQELVELALQELISRPENASVSIRKVTDKLNQKVLQLVEQTVIKLKELAAMKPEEYRALIANLGEATGKSASNVIETTTLLVAAIVVIFRGYPLYF